MKVQVIRSGHIEAAEAHTVSEYETDDAWFVRLETEEGFIIQISERGGSFLVHSTNAAPSILPGGSNNIVIGRR